MNADQTPLSRRNLLKIGAAGLGAAVVSPASLTTCLGETMPVKDELAFKSKRTGSPVYLTNLGDCLPNSALSPEGKRYCWRAIDYETASFKGVMLHAGEETQAAEATYPLSVRGWHDIYLGMFNMAWRPYRDQRLWVRLKGDPAFSLLFLPKPSQLPWGVPLDDNIKEGPTIQEVCWKTADLTDQTLSFKQPCQLLVPQGQTYGNSCGDVWIAYIKLVPLSENEVAEVQKDRSRTDTKRLFAYNDAWSSPHTDRGKIMPGESSAATIKAQLEPYRHTDFARIYWEGAHGDVCHYFTKIGRKWTREHFQVEALPRTADRLVIESWEDYLTKGIDPFEVAVNFSHEIGLEFHACYRLGWGAFYWPPPFDGYNRGGFFAKHAELRCVRRDGSSSSAISYAFPETTRFVRSLFREMAEYPIDGICMLYNRQPPLLGYESPLVEGFQRQYGHDPRKLDDKDPRWLAYRCSVLTNFMRELRTDLDQAKREQKRLKRVPITAWVFGKEEENLYYGLDLKTWIREGLVDTLIPYTSAPKLFSWEVAWEDSRDVEYWLSLTRGTSCELALNVMPRDFDSNQYRRKADALYGAGVEYLAFWDTPIVGARSSEALRRLGHRDEIADWVRNQRKDELHPKNVLKKLGDWDMEYLPE